MLEHSIEIFDDTRRRQMMVTARHGGKTPGKGMRTFEECVRAAEAAVNVFGPGRYAAALVLGMDDIDTTLNGMQRLAAVGVTQATAGIFVPNAFNEIGLQRMSFADMMIARRASANYFTLPNIFATFKQSS